MTQPELFQFITTDSTVHNVELVTKADGERTITVHFSDATAALDFLHSNNVYVLDKFITDNYTETATLVYVNITDSAMYKVYVAYTNSTVVGLNIARDTLQVIERKVYKFIPAQNRIYKLEGIAGEYRVRPCAMHPDSGILTAVGTNNKTYTFVPKAAFPFVLEDIKKCVYATKCVG